LPAASLPYITSVEFPLRWLLSQFYNSFRFAGPVWIGGTASGVQPKEITYYAAVSSVISICVAISYLQEPANKLAVPLFPGELLSGQTTSKIN
jgi:hypothetical protein